MELIKLENVSFSYTKDKEIISNVNLSLKDTGLVVILGRSGSGKSTLLSLLNDSLKPTKGKIIKSSKVKISTSFQSPLLLDYLNVKENVSLPLYLNYLEQNKDQTKVEEILEKVGLSGFASREVNNLSGGEKMRVSIARAIIDDAKVLILDEPTGALDEKTSLEIYSLIKELSKDILVILVSHDKENIKNYADYLYEIEDGKINLLFKKEVKEKEQIIKEKKQEHISFIKGIYLNYKYLIKHKLRIILCLIFLSFSFSFQYIGLNIYRNIDNTLASILDNFYSSNSAYVTKVEEVNTSTNLKLEKISLPSKKDLELINVKKAKSSLDYFVPQYKEVSLNNINYDCHFIPVLSEDKNKLVSGSGLNKKEDVVVNSLFLETFKINEDYLNKGIYFNHQFVINDENNNSDICNLELTFNINGVSKETSFFSEPIIYYSYSGIEEILDQINCKNISSNYGYEISVFDMLETNINISSEINSRSYIFENNNIIKVKEEIANKGINLKLTSKIIEIFDSTKEIILSITKIVLVYLILFIILSSLLLFLSMYSLYEQNTRFLALAKIFSSNKINNLILTLTNGIIFFCLSLGLILILSLICTGIGNMIFNSLGFPSFIKAVDILSLFIVTLILLLITLAISFLSRLKIRDSKIKKELEGED